ncbi:putative zinc-type alcohol dehydrogenase-like protein [Dokdonia sp. Hel_I_63]|uniref:NAD(P)-dependent alcohol dehydrogenase n=1 Tax=unclassified Dokdonia TaxID=2615033 RepID=UPI00020A6A40|nr:MULTISPECIES: NAD(P)-dependent alcohol dehydrogenase [unclassified Dokdonia]AEE20685.1 Alcohol dehydrogenase GroES domain protein [Dokdonia sp. 4H-3-7-5]TVZ23059.1 putative zinc-type alcohol dehydrogenase-like protein [Dokdonia sp. Hel_I_63]
MTEVKAYGAQDKEADLKEMTIKRRDTLSTDVKIKITYCGVCHSDIHTVRSDWGPAMYPVVPGHEIVGEVIEVGSDVTGFKKGDVVGVGCLVDSCQECSSCKSDLEQFCKEGATWTYNSKDKHTDGHTFGGYSQEVTVDQNFVLNIPSNLDIKAVAPLLCAGITTFSPLHHWGIKEGMKVGIVGLGGLGHMGIKFSHAMGAETVMITTSKGKADDAKRLGADSVLISKDEDAMEEQHGTFDFILNTVPVSHDINPYLALLGVDGTMCMVGAIEPLPDVHGGNLIMGRKSVAGSLIGGIKETQEMLDFCGKHNIVSDIEMIDMKNINEAYERVQNNDVKYRFVIDMDTL